MISAPATAVSNADTGSYTKGCHMAKKKNGRNPRNTMESSDRKLIGNAFDDAIRFARESSSHPNVPKIYDLVGPILKRRKAAVYNLLPEIRKRFGHLYGNSDPGL